MRPDNASNTYEDATPLSTRSVAVFFLCLTLGFVFAATWEPPNPTRLRGQTTHELPACSNAFVNEGMLCGHSVTCLDNNKTSVSVQMGCRDSVCIAGACGGIRFDSPLFKLPKCNELGVGEGAYCGTSSSCRTEKGEVRMEPVVCQTGECVENKCRPLPSRQP